MVVFGVEARDELGIEKHKVSIMRSVRASVATRKDAATSSFGAPNCRK